MNTLSPVPSIEKIASPPAPPVTALATGRILILMSDTGGGHRAAAEALTEGLHSLCGSSVEVSVVDAWRDYTAWPVSRLQGVYGWIVNKAVWLWRLLWRLEKRPALVNGFFGLLLYPLVAPGLRRLFRAQRPDVIVSVHPLLTQFALLALERAGLSIPFVTVVTDLISGSRLWFRPSTTLCLVPTASIGGEAVRAGVSPERVRVVGQPVSLKLTARLPDKGRLRRQLGLEPGRPLVLLAGGGEGCGRLGEIAWAVAQRLPRAQMVIVTGRNRALHTRLARISWPGPVHVLGFVTNMPDLMRAADVFVTKAGPGSLSEAFVAGLPVIIFNYIPGQEEGNVRYVLQHQAGVYEPTPAAIADLLVTWLQPGNRTLEQLARRAARLAQPGAALSAARCVVDLMRGGAPPA